VDALAEAHDTWWSVSAGGDRSHMEAYVNTDPHLSTMDLLDQWCDEAAFVDWEPPGAELPDWQTNWSDWSMAVNPPP
jgi:hypothetical protein